MTRQQELTGKIAAVRAEVERIDRSPYDRRKIDDRRGCPLDVVEGRPAFIRRGSYAAHAEEFEGLSGLEVAGGDQGS